MGLIESFGAEEHSEGDDVCAATTRELAASTISNSDAIERYGFDNSELRRAASTDLRQFLEAVVTPVTFGEVRLAEDNSAVEAEGGLEAVLAQSVLDVASSRAVAEELSHADSDDEVVELLKGAVQARFVELIPMGPKVNGNDAVASPPDETEIGVVETYGSDDIANALDRIGEVFDRARTAPARAGSTAFLAATRERLHANLARFQGDVLVYLNARGDVRAPGPIVTKVLEAVRSVQNSADPSEPTIVVTHSMGGNIIYDILTYYAPEVRVDFWISVGGQVSLFEEMKLFRASDRRIKSPSRVASPIPAERWLNVFDPLDVLSFVAEPIFTGVRDQEYHTGASALKSHGEYFGRASLHNMMGSWLLANLRAANTSL